MNWPGNSSMLRTGIDKSPIKKIYPAPSIYFHYKIKYYQDLFLYALHPAIFKSLFSILVFILLSRELFAQDIVIKQVSLSKGKVVLDYDITDANPDHKYTIRLYSSKDNFVQPLARVSGDIGVAVPVGGNKEVAWDARQELDSGFNGDVSLELKGQIYIPFLTLNRFEDYGTFKRGKPYDITWSGGRGDNIMNFDLYRGNEKVWTQPNVANTGNLKLTFPKNVKPGKNYKFRISDSKDPDEVIYTSQFAIKRKIPQALKIVPVLIVAGGVYILLEQFQSPSTIPDPPYPTRN